MIGSAETRGKVAFAAAVAILVVGAVAMAMLDHNEEFDASAVATREESHALPSVAERADSEHGREMRVAASSARHFVQAYLRYQEGRLRSTDRESLLRYSTRDLGGQLVRAPVRVPPGSRVPRQFVARIAGVQAGLFDGRPALLVTVVVAGSSGTHLLSASLIGQGGTWAVAGIGP